MAYKGVGALVAGMLKTESRHRRFMHTPATIAKHPIHPMLITLPIGLWVFSLVCDLASLTLADRDAAAIWSTVALYTMGGGIIGAVLAAVAGFIDLLSLPKGHIKKIAITHMSLNVAVVVIYAFNIGLRVNEYPSNLPIGLSVLTVLMLAVSGWLGGEMVHVHGVTVEPVPGDRRRVHLDAERSVGVSDRRIPGHFG